MRIFFGWVKESNMPSVYKHMDDDDVNELALLEAGIKKGRDAKSDPMQPF